MTIDNIQEFQEGFLENLKVELDNYQPKLNNSVEE